MRIGILTLPLRYNYGGILQAWALETVLTRMGHDVLVLNPNIPKRSMFLRHPLRYAKRIALNFIGKKVPIFPEKAYYKTDRIIAVNLRRFIDMHIKEYRYDDLSDIKEKDFDMFVVGSDQVWRPQYFLGRRIKNAFLSFTKGWNVGRISYAASFGKDSIEDWSQKCVRDCGEALKMFNAVSVRESSGVKICKEKFGVYAIQVLDPTMLLCKDDYLQLIKSFDLPKSPGNLHYYFLDETSDKMSLVDLIAKERNLVPFRVNSKVEDHSANIKDRIQPPLEQWLRAFCDSDFIITDSFHACVFSIIFNKQFVVYVNENRGTARYESLLNPLRLTNRIVHKSEDFHCIDLDINYSIVNKRLDVLRERSMKYLCDSVKIYVNSCCH